MACNSPLRLIKGTIAEGGIRSPLIVTGPGVPSDKRSDTLLHITDIAPTLLVIADAKHPQTRNGKETLVMQGNSMLTCWEDARNIIRSYTDHLAWELLGWKAARMGDWKATWLSPPFGQSKWQLFNLKSDPGEATDLASKNPDKLQTLIRIYDDYAKRNGVIESLRKIDM